VTGLIRTLRRVAAASRALWRDESGAILVYVTVGMAVFLGFAALIIDGGRIFVLHSQLQDAADAAALAGAAELNGQSDAITRAQSAINNTGALVTQNYQTFGTGSSLISITSIAYLAALPSSDATAITSANILCTGAPTLSCNSTTDPAQARFVRVITETRSTTNTFARYLGAGATTSTRASAVAGLDNVVCGITPMFICNPYEGVDTLTNLLADPVYGPKVRQRTMLLKPQSGSNAWGPGNFGLLSAIDALGTGANGVRNAFAALTPGQCYRQTAVKTGNNTGPVNDGINVRFDIYKSPLSTSTTIAGNPIPPAMNVTKGLFKANTACPNTSQLNSDTAHALPLKHDTCIDSSSCSPTSPTPTAFATGGVVGDGVWDFDSYWAVNHPGLTKPTSSWQGLPANSASPWSNSNLPSRYQVYRWEIDNSHIPNNFAAGYENGNPACYTGTVNDSPDRRVLFVAVFNCSALGLHGSMGGAQQPAIEFVKVFVTESMDVSGSNTNMYGEIIDKVVLGNGGGELREVVQLYR
jgi:Flp pilus assembly protein TadG